jgi:hypothetical protein
MDALMVIGPVVGAAVIFFWREERLRTAERTRRDSLCDVAIAQRNATVAARLTKFPEPKYVLSVDPSLAEFEREAISRLVPCWAEFEIEECYALEPYIAAEEDLTPELREEIIEENRRVEYPADIERAKQKAKLEWNALLAEEADNRQAEVDAKKRLAEFIARQRSN